MRVTRIIHPGFWFGKTDKEAALALAQSGVGGFCIYGGTATEVKDLIRSLRRAAPNPLIISADYEDGLGRWIAGAPHLPSNLSIGASGNTDLAYKKGFLTAQAARELGVDWVFAPVVDLADESQNPIVNTRAFGLSPKLVEDMARHFCRGLQDGGCLNSLKHFPGHGGTREDSHLSLPVVERTLAQLEEADLQPYKNLMAVADSIMVSHLLVPGWDGDNPASFSSKIITGYLRGALRYRGVVVSDALMMGAAAQRNPLDSFAAGADILLAPADPQKLIEDLQSAVAGDRKLLHRAASALCAQEFMLAKLACLFPQKTPLSADDLSQETARAAIAAVGEPVKLRAKTIVHYLEPEFYPEQDFKAKDFLAVLQKNNIKVRPYKEGDKPAVLLAASMLSYGAFRGSVNFTQKQKKLLAGAVAASKKSVLIGFGSPFVNLGVDGLTLFLMAATPTTAFQQTAAQILLGQAEAKGSLPV